MVATVPQSERDPAKIAFTVRALAEILNQRTAAMSFSNRPTLNVFEGAIMPFTDSATSTWGATITGGGAVHVLGYYNGTNWTVAAR